MLQSQKVDMFSSDYIGFSNIGKTETPGLLGP
jgi:hypothetical protein